MKIFTDKFVSAFIISRGLYALANSAVPVLLAIAVASDGYDITGIGIVLGVGALPGIVGALLAPQLLVRVSPKHMFAGAALIWALICAIFGWFAMQGPLPLLAYAMTSFVLELVAALMYPSVGSYVVDLVQREHLKTVNSMRAVVSGVSAVLGPGLVAIVQSWLGVEMAWWTISGIMVLCLLSQVALPQGKRTAVDQSGRVWGRGLLTVRRQRGISVVLTASAIWHLTAWACFMTVVPVVLRDDYQTLWFVGVSESLFAIGGIIGSMIPSPRSVPPPTLCLVALLSFMPVPLGVVFGAPLWLVGLAVLVSSLVLASTAVAWETFLQSAVERQDLPSIFALDYLAGDGVAPIGYLFVPLVISATGITLGVTVLIGSAIIIIVGCLPWSRTVSLAARDTSEDES